MAYKRLASEVLARLPKISLLELHQPAARATAAPPEASASASATDAPPQPQGGDAHAELPVPPLRMGVGSGPSRQSWLQSAASKLGLR